MPLLKTTWIMQIQRHSFSESWYRNAGTPNPVTELVAAKQYAVARAAILGYGSYIYAIRISNTEDRRQKAYLEYVNYPGNQELVSAGVPLHPSAASNVALNMEFQNADFTQEKLIQLRGIWDEVETQGGSWNFLDPIYVPLIQAYGAKVVQLMYGWRYTSTVQKFGITNWATQGDGRILFAFSGQLFTLDQANSHAHVPCRITNATASPNLNGPLTLVAMSQTTALSLKPIAAFPYGDGAFCSRSVLSFAQSINGRVQRIGKRQAGAPLLQSVGRGKVRTRG